MSNAPPRIPRASCTLIVDSTTACFEFVGLEILRNKANTRIETAIKNRIFKRALHVYQFDSKKRRQEMIDKGFAIDNPAYLAGAKVVSATTNIPLDRALLKYDNFTGAFEEEKEWWESVAMILGWPEWQLKSEKKQGSRSRSNRSKSSRSSGNRNKSKRT